MVVVEGGSGSYRVRLRSRPTRDVTLSMQVAVAATGVDGAVTVGPVTGAGTFTVSPVSLTFTPDSFDMAQTVSVALAQDAINRLPQNLTILHNVTSADPQ